MVDKSIFERIEEVIKALGSHETFFDTILATNEELGELSKAARIELTHCSKTNPEPAKVEAVDLILCGIEAYIRLGGTHVEMLAIASGKLSKYEASVEKRLSQLEEQ